MEGIYSWFFGKGSVVVTRESGGEGMVSALCGACFAPFLLLGALILLGWNEHHTVCKARAAIAGFDRAQEQDCNSATAGNGDLILFSCNVKRDGLVPWTVESGAFKGHLMFLGTCMSVQSEMYQCVEHKSSTTQKDSVGGGTKTTTTYSYSKEWKEEEVSDAWFENRNSLDFRHICGQGNPAWPRDVPQSRVEYRTSALIGQYNVSQELLRSIPCNRRVQATSVPRGWTEERNGVYQRQPSGQLSLHPEIGTVQVAFAANDWANPMHTVLGRNENGRIVPWRAPSSWLCSGYTLHALQEGERSKEEFFAALQDENQQLTWALRAVGCLLCWVSFCLLFRPLEVTADCIPCIGPMLGDVIAGLIAVVSCPPGIGCALGVIGIVWAAMRPSVGIPLILMFLAGVVGTLVAASFLVSKRRRGRTEARSSMQGIQLQPFAPPTTVALVQPAAKEEEEKPIGP